MAAVATAPKLSIDEFVRRYEVDGPFEIIDGEIIEIMTATGGHHFRIHFLLKLLLAYLLENPVGEAMMEAPFILPDSDDSEWVKGSRTPDLLFYAGERFPNYQAETPNWETKPYMLIPDLTVEVVSKNDIYSDVRRKVDAYLTDGVRLIWIIDPLRQKVEVYTNEGQITLSAEDTLTGGEVLLGFEVAVATLFG